MLAAFARQKVGREGKRSSDLDLERRAGADRHSTSVLERYAAKPGSQCPLRRMWVTAR